MYVEKVLECTLNIENALVVFSNLKENLLHILADKFEGRCYQNLLIKNIVSIIRNSEGIFNNLSNECIVTMHVIFKAEGISFAPGNVVVGCKVIHKNPNIVLGQTEDASVTMANSKELAPITIGQFIPVRVLEVLYTIYNNRISIRVEPYIPSKTFRIYEINGSVPVEKLTEFQMIVTDEIAAFSKLKGSNASAVDFFSKIIHPHAEPSVAEPLVEFASMQANFKGWYGRDSRLAIGVAGVVHYDEAPEGEVITGSPVTMLENLVTDYVSQLRLVRELVEFYSTQKLLQDHRNLWKVLSQVKKAV